MTLVNLNEYLQNIPESEKSLEGWTLYNDETNNFRKIKIKEDNDFGYNIGEKIFFHDFVLGGIALKPGNLPDCTSLVEKLPFKKGSEFKFKSFFKHNNNFLDEIGNPNVTLLLQWFVDNDVYIHFFTINWLYYSIIDLVDEVLKVSVESMVFHKSMKDSLFNLIMNNIQEFTSILNKNGYPNISSDNIWSFCRGVADFIECYESKDFVENFSLELLRQNMKTLAKNSQLIFLNDGQSGVIQDSYYDAYFNMILEAPDAIHIFDYEPVIKKKFDINTYLLDGEIYTNFKFVDSKTDIYIQISDVIVGIIGNFFSFCDSVYYYGWGDIKIDNLSLEQLKSFHMLYVLFQKSEKEWTHSTHYLCATQLYNVRHNILLQLNQEYLDKITK